MTEGGTPGAGERLVRIRYRRPPDHETVYTQTLLDDRSDVKITLARSLEIPRPRSIDGELAMEPGGAVVWFTFPGVWHDIGAFHRTDGTLTGHYANILTPPDLSADDVWITTDLFLDVWMARDRRLTVLDEAEFEEAVARGWLEPEWARQATLEVERIRTGAASQRWPPPVVFEWTLERALRVAAGDTP